MRRFRMVADQPDFLPPGLAGGHERIERGRIGQVATIPPHLAWSDSRIGIREVHGPQGPPELELLVHGHIEERAIVVEADRKSTRLNSSHSQISYAVFCLKKKKKK